MHVRKFELAPFYNPSLLEHRGSQQLVAMLQFGSDKHHPQPGLWCLAEKAFERPGVLEGKLAVTGIAKVVVGDGAVVDDKVARPPVGADVGDGSGDVGALPRGDDLDRGAGRRN